MPELGIWLPMRAYTSIPSRCSGLYIVRHRDTGKEYVGKSVNMRHRLAYHIDATRPNSKVPGTYFYRALRKHGLDAFEFCVHALGSPQELNALEVLLIAERQTLSPGGFNATIGGDGVPGRVFSQAERDAIRLRNTGSKRSPETRRRMSEALKGKVVSEAEKQRLLAMTTGRVTSQSTKEKLAAAMRGRKVSDETRARQSAALKGLPGIRGADHAAAKVVGMWEPGSSVPKIYGSCGEAAEAAGVCPNTLSYRISGSRPDPGGRVFAYL